MLTPTRLTFAALLALTGCPKQVSLPKGPDKPVTYKLLTDTPEDETANRKEERPDVWVRTETQNHVPVVVAKGEAGPIKLFGGRAQICADEACEKGVVVDNFLLFEVVDAGGKVTHRFVMGFHEGVSINEQEPDNVGALGFNLVPGADVTTHLPPDEPFTLRVAALDYGGVGKVSDVYLRVTARGERTPSEDELKTWAPNR
jgi:hypothetical protein